MLISVTNPIKSSKPERTGNILPYAGHRGTMKPRSYYSTSSASINMMAVLPPVPDSDWYLYDEDYYIGKMYALDIHSVYIAEINKVASNPRESRQYYTSNPCVICVNTVNTFD